MANQDKYEPKATITHNIQVIVAASFVQGQSSEFSDKNYLFTYRIDIKNLGNETMQLISRHWIIINSEGETEEIKGEGVIGYTPILKPGDSFNYSSYCPLDTSWGTMEGSFTFVNIYGTEFVVEVGRFYLIS
jgi:ApaG protein